MELQELIISPTTYGSEIKCYPKLEFTGQEILHVRILEIDTLLTDDLHLGTHRIYKFGKLKGEVFGRIYCKMEYSAFFNSEKNRFKMNLK